MYSMVIKYVLWLGYILCGFSFNVFLNFYGFLDILDVWN